MSLLLPEAAHRGSVPGMCQVGDLGWDLLERGQVMAWIPSGFLF